MAKLAVIGAGKWGEALHSAILDIDPNALITSRTPRDIKN
ncbi:MAG: glycerol-3-phosphate dehydrogenase, partial [Arcobacter butzleri]|nr:glycerol-3-phosphate dehydrogenase [Aliarcobacter butzleri]